MPTSSSNLRRNISAAESKIEGLRLRKKHLTDLQADVQQTTQTREPNRFREQQSRFVGAGLSVTEWDAFRMEFKGNPAQIIQNAVKALDAAILLAVEGDPQHPLDASKVPPSTLPLKQLGSVRDASKSAVGIDAQKQKKYEELQRTIGQMESALRKLEAEHLHAKGAADRRKELQQRRRDEYVEVFNTFVEEETILGQLYAPLSKSLAASMGALSKLAFVVEREVKIEGWVKRGEDLLDLRRDSKFRGHGALLIEAEKYLLKPWSNGGPAEVAEAMDKFRSDFQEDFKKALPEFESQQDLRTRKMEITAWLYNTDHIKVQYGITYEGTPIERLSPGTRGIVLLLLYLAVDTHDLRPLFIDQPEENLDPRSVFTELVPHFRSAKQRRQVVIVTHNANLVVNTDADQIFIATSERKDDGALRRLATRAVASRIPTFGRMYAGCSKAAAALSWTGSVATASIQAIQWKTKGSDVTGQGEAESAGRGSVFLPRSRRARAGVKRMTVQGENGACSPCLDFCGHRNEGRRSAAPRKVDC